MTRWTYWATDARSDRHDTLEHVRVHGLMCRPFFNAAGNRIPRVSQLAAGDRIQLCHSGRPMTWLEIQRAHPRKGIEESDVFELVRADSRFGRALAKDDYRPDGRYFPHFTAIRVRVLDSPLVTPAPHRTRFAIEPFVPFEHE